MRHRHEQSRRGQPGTQSDLVARLDEFSRRWPLAACLVGFGYVAARGAIDGDVWQAVVFGLLSLGVLGALARLLRRTDTQASAGEG